MSTRARQAVDKVADSARDNLAVMLAMAALGAISAALWSLVMVGISSMEGQLADMETRYLLHDDEQTKLIMSMHNSDIGKMNLIIDRFRDHEEWAKSRWQQHDKDEDVCRRERGAIADRVHALEIYCAEQR